MPFYPILGEGSPTKIDYRQMGTLILTFLLEDLVFQPRHESAWVWTKWTPTVQRFGPGVGLGPQCTPPPTKPTQLHRSDWGSLSLFGGPNFPAINICWELKDAGAVMQLMQIMQRMQRTGM